MQKYVLIYAISCKKVRKNFIVASPRFSDLRKFVKIAKIK